MKRTKIAGILTIILGIAINSTWFVFFVSDLHESYLRYIHKGHFCSFISYVLTNGKPQILQYIIAVIICVLVGVCLIQKGNEHQESSK